MLKLLSTEREIASEVEYSWVSESMKLSVIEQSIVGG